ncbi:hypothetical protein [Algivirga pacifica]|uniref:LysM domain-containing protein n=1 Tax=Algivirga pacifica TaxID=1162670 RepID=A0ABP9D574_9BACT
MISYDFFGIAHPSKQTLYSSKQQLQHTATFVAIDGTYTEIAKKRIAEGVMQALLDLSENTFQAACQRTGFDETMMSEGIAVAIKEDKIHWVCRQSCAIFLMSEGKLKYLGQSPGNRLYKAQLSLKPTDKLLVLSAVALQGVSEEQIENILKDNKLSTQGKIDQLLTSKEENKEWGVLIERELLEGGDVPTTINTESRTPVNSKRFSLSFLDRNAYATFLVFSLFAALMLLLFFSYETYWEQKLESKDAIRQEEQLKVEELIGQIKELQADKKQQINAIREEAFDPYDKKQYRMYGLFRDTKNQYSRTTVAELFNIYAPAAIESKVKMGERWFVVPVKGIHWVEKGDTAFSIAKLYYENPENHRLITRFNGKLKAGTFVFIPFEG